jgi:uncharacterized protein YfaP (DUF2135 family)
LSLKASLNFRAPLKTQAVAADIHHLTFALVNASDGTTVASTVDALPPFAPTLNLSMPAPPDGTYRLTVEAFGGEAATTSLSVAGSLASANTVAVTGLVSTYSTGTAATFPAPLQLKAGGSIPATVTGTGGNRIDVTVSGGTMLPITTTYSPTTFPVRYLRPGTYALEVKLYDAAGAVVTQTKTSDPVTVGGPETGYAADGTFTVAF